MAIPKLGGSACYKRHVKHGVQSSGLRGVQSGPMICPCILFDCLSASAWCFSTGRRAARAAERGASCVELGPLLVRVPVHDDVSEGWEIHGWSTSFRHLAEASATQGTDQSYRIRTAGCSDGHGTACGQAPEDDGAAGVVWP